MEKNKELKSEASIVLKRILRKDASLWVKGKREQQDVKNRLGWLNVIEFMQTKVDSLHKFSLKIKSQGFTDIVLLGMGGSSLAPYLFCKVFGSKKGYPVLHVLDTTDPEVVEAYHKKLKLERTLFIVASKSGTTIESISLYKYFFQKVSELKEKPGQNFISITDRNTSLEKIAKKNNFRRNFTNPSDIGGRYSALSYFGLVPAVLIGIDIKKILDSARMMKKRCQPKVENHPIAAWVLGSFLSKNVKEKKNKLTIICDPEMKTFSMWLEQLLAESTGKKKTGVIPVVLEPRINLADYKNDRFFCLIGLSGNRSKRLKDKAEKLKNYGFPVMEFYLKGKYSLGGEFFRWEMATAICGYHLGINPFDEPNVTESKNKTKEILKRFNKTGRLISGQPRVKKKGINIYASQNISQKLGKNPRPETVLKSLLQKIPSQGYLAILAYLPYTSRAENLLYSLRVALSKQTRKPVLFGFGPRYLHSIGQEYKGGPEEGAFLIISRKIKDSPLVPGEKYSFWQLQIAQALGDYQVLKENKRPVLHLHYVENYFLSLEEMVKKIRL